MRIRIFLSLSLVIILATASLAQVIETKKAPDFTLPDINGKNVTFSKLLGRGPVYISFWATWCKPCLEELKIMEKIYEKYKDQGFQVYAINTDGPKASAKIKSFVKTYGMTFNILLDNDNEVFRRTFKGANMPFTILTNADGKILFSGVGFKPGDEIAIEKLIVANLLSQSTPADTTKQSGAGK
jgi:cytochrome c biogenesis protein CcmG, thiol:disulfide interchange protein DsbE